MKINAGKRCLRKALLIAKKRKPGKTDGAQPEVCVCACHTTGDGPDLAWVISGREKHRIATTIEVDTKQPGNVIGDLEDFDKKVRACNSGQPVQINWTGDPPNHKVPVVRNHGVDAKPEHVVETIDGDSNIFQTSEDAGDFEEVTTVSDPQNIQSLRRDLHIGYRMCQSTNRVQDRPNLQAVHYEGLGGSAGISATDSAGAVHTNTILKTPNEIDIPYNTAEVISYAIRKEDPFKIEILKNDEDEYKFIIGDTTIFFEQVLGKFPDVSDVVFMSHDTKDTFKAHRLINTVSELADTDSPFISVVVTESEDGSDEHIDFCKPGNQPDDCKLEIQLEAKGLYKKIKGTYNDFDGEIEVEVGEQRDPIRFHHYNEGWGEHINLVVMGINPNAYEKPVNL